MKSAAAKNWVRLSVLVGVCATAVSWARGGQGLPQVQTAWQEGLPWVEEPAVTRVEIKDPVAARIVAAAASQIGDLYNASYRKLSYPGGDVPQGEGACTDVVVRALRGAGKDLQQLIHEDMRANFGLYPRLWSLNRTDRNIDHRRVPNHMTFFRRHGKSLPLGLSGKDLATWLPGDIVCWKMEGGKWHTGVISDGIGPSGLPLVIHNAFNCVEQDYLTAWPIVGHYRYPRR